MLFLNKRFEGEQVKTGVNYRFTTLDWQIVLKWYLFNRVHIFYLRHRNKPLLSQMTTTKKWIISYDSYLELPSIIWG